MTTIPFGTKRQQPRVASTTFFHDMIKKYFFGLNHFWVWLIRLSLTDAHSLTSWIYIFWKKTPWFVWWERLNSLAIFSLSIQYWRTQRATEGKRKDTCFLFSFPNVSGNKEELCLNYLGYVPCVPRSFLMFLYICFDIQKRKKKHIQSVADRRRKWRTESMTLRELQLVNQPAGGFWHEIWWVLPLPSAAELASA